MGDVRRADDGSSPARQPHSAPSLRAVHAAPRRYHGAGMKPTSLLITLLALRVAVTAGPATSGQPPAPPRFSVGNMDRTVDPRSDFYRFAAGNWLRENPVPDDKSRWSGFDELQERNWALVRGILEDATRGGGWFRPRAVRQVGAFYRSAMDTNRLERLRFTPLQPDLRRISGLGSRTELVRFAADLQERGIPVLFEVMVWPDFRDSTVYELRLGQGGLGLPDRDYYLAEGFATQREAYRAHVTRMLTLLGDSAEDAAAGASTILELETALARASRTRTDLRDPVANNNPEPVTAVAGRLPALELPVFLGALGLADRKEVNLGQPDFFAGLDSLLAGRPLDDWRTYLRWHVLRAAAPCLHAEVEAEQFAFYGTTLRGQPRPEPRWQRAARAVDSGIGEALGRLYVERHFPPAARARMDELVEDLRAVFRDRLERLDWMSPETRARALAKFARFTRKIGHPDTFREYPFAVRAGDYLGNVQRAHRFESRRQLARVGGPVDRSEWEMTPQTVNAYFNPPQNEIVFPAGILQPPFFDLEADDAINYGAIGVVIGHEITHGFDDQGRKYDADGNLNDWWTPADAAEFQSRARLLVEQFGGYEPLPGRRVNGELTLGENIADLGGASIAFEALQRALARDPSRRRTLDGFSPEQRFFISLAQLWRVNWREAELVRRLTVDPHAPAQYRAIGAHVNLDAFHEAFGVRPGDPMHLPPERRARIW